MRLIHSSSLRSRRGFTLIEVIIYIALFSLLMTGGIMAGYQIIETSDRAQARSVAIEETLFVLRKIEWALRGATAVTVAPNPGANLRVVSGELVIFSFHDAAIFLNTTPLTSRNLKVTTVSFTKVFGGAVPDSLRVNIVVTDLKKVDHVFEKIFYLLP